eukprot:TRINITY_DN3876_c0_g1_i11.p1 TRINITY_DN3876_c0_g1~~TRINITY_DN3876_c0_g1_i11.p1  ORF type:complete len:229 (-),score=50.88 TRINITY_DN3876_c0_g1_i11:69-755(-)
MCIRDRSKDLCGNQYHFDRIWNFQTFFQHSSTSLNLKIFDDSSLEIERASWAVKKLKIVLYKCHPSCKECVDATICKACVDEKASIQEGGSCNCPEGQSFDSNYKCQSGDSQNNGEVSGDSDISQEDEDYFDQGDSQIYDEEQIYDEGDDFFSQDFDNNEEESRNYEYGDEIYGDNDDDDFLNMMNFGDDDEGYQDVQYDDNFDNYDSEVVSEIANSGDDTEQKIFYR